MRKLMFVLMLFGFLSFSSIVIAIDIGSRYHITGCGNGKLIVPIVNIWSKSDGGVEGATIVGKLSGGGDQDLGLQCQGAIVEVLDIHEEYIKVQSIDGKMGWVSSGFIGKKVE